MRCQALLILLMNPFWIQLTPWCNNNVFCYFEVSWPVVVKNCKSTHNIKSKIVDLMVVPYYISLGDHEKIVFSHGALPFMKTSLLTLTCWNIINYSVSILHHMAYIGWSQSTRCDGELENHMHLLWPFIS